MPRRLLNPYSLFAIFLLVVTGIGFWLWQDYRRVQSLRAAVTAINGDFEVQSRLPLSFVNWMNEKEWQDWIAWLETDVTAIRIYDSTEVNDDWIKRLRPCSSLQTLALKNVPVTDAGLNSLDSFPHLKHLYLEKTRISDSGLKRVGALPRLEALHVDGTAVTKAGVASLQASRPNLRIYGP